MLKKLIVTAALMGVTAYTHGQGTVDFDTKAVGARVLFTVENRPDLGTRPATGTPDVAGALTPFYGQLYAAAGSGVAESALQPVGTRLEFRGGGSYTSGNAGFLQDLAPVEVTSTGGGPATVQLRAWSGAETFALAETAVAANINGSGAGKSALLNLSTTGNPNGVPPTTQVALDGLQGFTFEVQNIPEPSTVALGVLGAAALIFARRRK